MTNDPIIDKMVAGLYQQQRGIEDFVHKLFGHEPAERPNVVIGDLSPYVSQSGILVPGSHVSGIYVLSRRILGVDPAVIVAASQNNGTDPYNAMVRTYGKEYSQHVYDSLNGHTGAIDALLTAVPAVEHHIKNGGDLPLTRIVVEHVLPMARMEAFGLYGVRRLAKFLGHQDDYNADAKGLMTSAVLWAAFVNIVDNESFKSKRKEQRSALIEEMAGMGQPCMSMLVLVKLAGLTDEEFRAYIRRDFSEVREEEAGFVSSQIKAINMHDKGSAVYKFAISL